MASGVHRFRFGWAALAVALAPLGAFADDSLSLPRSVAAPLDLAPTGALAPDSQLDLAPPSGLMVELPPEAPPPATRIVGAHAPPVVAPAPSPEPHRPEAAQAAELAPQAPPVAVETPAALAEAKPDLPAAAPALDAAPSPADALHAALDAWIAAKPIGRPIGAGDWQAARRAVGFVYAQRAYAPLWIENGGFGARAKAVLARLSRSGEDGLDAPAVPLASADPARADIALSAAVVAYAMQASGARLSPRALSKDVTPQPEIADPAAALSAVADATDPSAALANYNPPQPEYRALRAALALLRAEAPSAKFSNGPTLKLGMSDPRVPLIRARFGLGAAPDAAQVYDVRVVSAVASFQRVHGLAPNGVLTADTANALAGGVAREKRVVANMEMWRWMPRDMGDPRVEVDVPAFELKVTSGGQVVHRARVIVGKPDTPTPIFSNAIRYLLLNPAWHVPESIVKKEMAPHMASDPGYFARHGYKVTYVGDQLTVEQPPGEENALGRMLFLFPNEHAVYLHDTPQRGLFTQGFRALSHGCVRVEDPARLAELLMGGAARGWSQDRIRSLVGDKERTVSLAAPVPVHLEYFTEVADSRGALESRSDLYGLTDKVVAALQAERRD